MKCPACNTYITKIPVNWKCPHCLERLPDPSKWVLFWEGLAEYLQEKGIIFWSVTFGLFLILCGLLELLAGHAYLLGNLGGSPLVSMAGIFFGGMLLDTVMRINLPLRVLFGADFIIRERPVVRNIRKATNGAILVGIAFAMVYAGPMSFFLYFTGYVVIVAWWLALTWSIVGLFIDPRLMEDVRIRTFLEKLGILSLRRYRKIGTVMIGLLVLVMVVFMFMMGTHNLWLKLSNFGPFGALVQFSKSYLGWLF